MQYPMPGKGSVKVYWDRPANDVGNDPTDRALMATIVFAVLPPGYGTPTPEDRNDRNDRATGAKLLYMAAPVTTSIVTDKTFTILKQNGAS